MEYSLFDSRLEFLDDTKFLDVGYTGNITDIRTFYVQFGPKDSVQLGAGSLWQKKT